MLRVTSASKRLVAIEHNVNHHAVNPVKRYLCAACIHLVHSAGTTLTVRSSNVNNEGRPPSALSNNSRSDSSAPLPRAWSLQWQCLCVIIIIIIIIIFTLPAQAGHLYTSSSGRPVGCMSILLKQHLNTHKQQLRALGLQIIIVCEQPLVVVLCTTTSTLLHTTRTGQPAGHIRTQHFLQAPLLRCPTYTTTSTLLRSAHYPQLAARSRCAETVHVELKVR